MLGFNLKSATAFTKVMNLTSNLVALSIFLYAGKVLIQLGLMMALAQVVGALLGSRFVLKYDIRWIRYVFLAVIFALILKLYLGQ